MRRETLTRKQMLAAELHGYSYANYADHLGIGNIRFDKLMPNNVDVLERAAQERWKATRIAQALDMPEGHVESWQRLYLSLAPTRLRARYAISIGLRVVIVG